MGAADWGSVPAWVSSFAAVLALLFAAAAALLSRRTFRIQSDQHRAALEAERQAQAALVSVWWGWHDDDREKWGAYVRNASQAPVYQAHVAFLSADGRKTVAKIGPMLVPPSDQPVFYRVDGELNGCRTRLTFTDATGSRWIRDEYGHLNRLRPELIMWIGDDIARMFTEFREDIQSSYGVRFHLDTTDVGDRLRIKYVAEAKRAGNVDVFVGPHDWVGDLVAKGVAEPVVLSEEQRQVLSQRALQALSINGQTYGIPATIDTIVLVRNVDLAGQEPASFEEMMEIGRRLRRAGSTRSILAVPVGPDGDPFMVWPLLSSGGAWLFRTDSDGTWDPRQVGIDSPESVSAFARLRSLGETGEGVLRRDVDRPRAHRMFLGGECPFMLGSYGDLSKARNAGIRVEVSPVPAFLDGKPPIPFVTVYGFYLAPFGRNRVIASDLTDYLTRFDVMSALSARVGAPVARNGATATADPTTSALHAACDRGLPIPSFAEMSVVWRHLGLAELDVIAGGDPETATRRAANAIRQVLGA